MKDTSAQLQLCIFVPAFRFLSGNGEREDLVQMNFWWLHALAETSKQKFGVVVHITWERGSIYFEDIKVYGG
jgi:hypothetical protein